MNALFVLADGFDDVEYFYLAYRLAELDVGLSVAGPGPHALTGSGGSRVSPDLPIFEADPADYDMLVIAGGRSPEALRVREEAVALARTFSEGEGLTICVGHGAQLLISAGVLVGVPVACSPGIRDDVRAAGGLLRDEPVAESSGLLSCRSRADLPMLGRALTARLQPVAAA